MTKLTGVTSWSGYAIDLPLTDIAEVDGNVVLKVAGGKADIMPPVLGVPVDVAQTSMTLQWSAVDNAVRYFVDVTAADGVKLTATLTWADQRVFGNPSVRRHYVFLQCHGG